MAEDSVGVLADGREIRYWDDVPGLVRSGVDVRELPPFAPGGQARRDPLTGQTIVIAAGRNKRTLSAAGGACPLCPSTPEAPSDATALCSPSDASTRMRLPAKSATLVTGVLNTNDCMS